MTIMEKQYKTKFIMYPMGSIEKVFETITTRALDEKDFSALMSILEKEGYMWEVDLNKDDSYSYLKPASFNPAVYVNKRHQSTKESYEIKDYNIRIIPDGYYRSEGRKIIDFIHKSHEPRPKDFVSCKKLLK